VDAGVFGVGREQQVPAAAPGVKLQAQRQRADGSHLLDAPRHQPGE
jgi:hypothetical protein